MICCHRPDCPDTHCPGRPHRPPHTSAVQSDNSDGTCPGKPQREPRPPTVEETLACIDRRLHWAMVWALVLAAASLLTAPAIVLTNP